ncbi:MAG: stimulus-sensing domain-containing protein [Pseudomonadota bacterium]|nr:stimulus-sensing domain-containing protein [Pseudomonadota bacterium]
MGVEFHTAQTPLSATPASRWRRSRLRLRLARLRRLLESNVSSSLTRRIVSLNLGGLVVLVVGFLLLNHFRADIIEARKLSLTTQADIIAAAISASAAVDTETLLVDPDKLLDLAPGDPAPAREDESLMFSLNPERIGRVLHRLVTPTHTRARIFDRDGQMLLDSQTLSPRSARSEAADSANEDTTFLERFWASLRGVFEGGQALQPAYRWSTNGKDLPEVARALDGKTSSMTRVNVTGETIVSVGVPIQRANVTRGVLVLSTRGGDIDKVIASERWGLLRFFMVIAGVMFVLSLSLANTIGEPVRKLADAADRVRRGIKSRQQIPDFTDRSDEIGHLSRALGEMTQAMYGRIDAIESFAADVAHELKNPLTSLRSAVETLPRVKSEPSRLRLMEIMQHDVRRLDRLISDISDASRLDAEMARVDSAPVDVAQLVRAVVAMLADSPRSRGISLKLTVDPGPDGARPSYFVMGHDSRLAQVVTNLVDNACSFSHPGGEVRVALRRVEGEGERVEIVVEDDGPGIPAHALERIFDRFYTDRPSEGFGQNSGLGLSISRQIVQAHGGAMWAENRPLAPGAPPHDHDGAPRHGAGARFVVSLPACS